ncbi:MAG: fibronectin type III domain-containing protein [Prosthecobacter sp.]
MQWALTGTAPMPLLYDTPGLRFGEGNRFDEAVVPVPPPNLNRKRRMPKIKLDLSKKTAAQKISLAQAHVTAMTGNANFPDAGRLPPDAAFATALTALETAEADAIVKKNDWKQAIATRDAAEAALDAALTTRASYCEAAQPSDEAALISAGLPLRPAPTPVGDLPAPGDLAATVGDNEGEIDLSCDPVPGASSYEWQCRVHADGNAWQGAKNSTTSKITVEGLIPGTLYAFRVRAIGSAGPGAWSDEATKRAP